jgi:hypothetical protein
MPLMLAAKRTCLCAAIAAISVCAAAAADPVRLRATPDDLIGRQRFQNESPASVSSETMEFAGDLWVSAWDT